MPHNLGERSWRETILPGYVNRYCLGVLGTGILPKGKPVAAMLQHCLIFRLMIYPGTDWMWHANDDEDAWHQHVGAKVVIVLDLQREGKVVFLKNLPRGAFELSL